MQDWIDILSAWHIGLGIASTVFAAIVGIIYKFDKRRSEQLDRRDERALMRDDAASKELVGVKERLDVLEGEVAAVTSRIGTIEGRLSLLATSEQVTEIRVSQARLEQQVTGLGNMLDTLYRAAIIASQKPEDPS